MKVLCVLNPLSGGGLPGRRWPQVAELLTYYGADHELLSAEDTPIERKVVERLSRGSPDEFAVVAGIGGDGTQSAVINGLMQYSKAHPGRRLPPYGFIPMGVGNDIAKSFGITARDDFFVDDLRKAVTTLIHGADYQLDLGLLRDRYFADAVTLGLDSAILRERNAQKRWLQGTPMFRRMAGGILLYLWSVGLRLARQKPFQATITIDGKEWYSGWVLNLVVNNTRIYAGEFDLCADGCSSDGLLDAVLFTGHTSYLARYLLSFRLNPRRVKKIADTLARVSAHKKGKNIVVELAKPEAAQMDGEEIDCGTRLDISVVPRAIHIKTPAEP